MPKLRTAPLFIKISHIASASNRTSAILVVKHKPLCLLIKADFPSVLWIEMIPFQFSYVWKRFLFSRRSTKLKTNAASDRQDSRLESPSWNGWWNHVCLRCERSLFGHVIPKAELLTDGLRWDAANSSVCRSGLPVGCTTGPGHHDQASTWQTEAPLFYRTMLTGNIIHSHDNEPVNTHPLCGWAFSPLHTHARSSTTWPTHTEILHSRAS